MKMNNNPELNKRLFTVITLNETRTILMFVQLTLGQLQEVLPKDIVRILKNERFRLPKETKVRFYTFRELIIESSRHYVVELNYNRFMKLFENESYHVCRKRIEPVVVELPVPVSLPKPQRKLPKVKKSSPKVKHLTNTNNNGDTKPKDKPSYYDGITRFLKYSLTYRPGKTLYDNERCNRLRA
jgi:hypothetical protein